MTPGNEAAGPLAGGDRHYTLTRLPGWLQMVDSPPRKQPAVLSKQQLAALPGQQRACYNDSRAVWHANLGPIRTPQLLALHDGLAEIVEANRHDGNRNKPAALVDSYAGLGKTTAVLDYARTYHRQQVELRGQTMPEGHRRIPVIYIALTGHTRIKGLNQALCRFYNLPTSGTADTLAARAADAVLCLGTQVFVIDDVHFLNMNRRDDQDLANHLKFLSNAFPVTMIYIGVGVTARGLLREGLSTAEALYAQFGRRTTALTLPPFLVETNEGRRQWRRLLLTIERKLVLADSYPGMLADDLSDYLYARSTGHFASLMTLITRGCLRAARTGTERLTTKLMDKVANDAAAEEARKELTAAITAGAFTTRPTPPAQRRAA
ncbi:MAG: ATP-binding protein [Natronosporangium sp.]